MYRLFFVMFIILSFNLMATEYDDQGCNIFISKALNVADKCNDGYYFCTGVNRSYYTVTVKVKKELIKRDYKNYEVVVVRDDREISSNGNYRQLKRYDEGEYYKFVINYSEGATHKSDSTIFKTYISNGIDSLWDNNMYAADREIQLSKFNGWDYQSKCNR